VIVDKYGRVGGSIHLATLAEMYAECDDDELKDHYRQVAADNGLDLEIVNDLAANYAVQPEVELEPEPESSGRPAQADNKAAWIDWAVSQGADRDEAEAATKAELIDEYGSD
jgi:hypothetical protein